MDANMTAAIMLLTVLAIAIVGHIYFKIQDKHTVETDN